MEMAPDPNDAPLVSVVIPAYNCARLLGRAIESALGQTYPNLECIVVDDGSTDGTPEVVTSFGDRVLALRQRNAGASAARNAGIAAARGRYIAFLDADDYWLDTKITNQIEVFRRHPELVLVGCDFGWDYRRDGEPDSGVAFDAERVEVFRDLTQLLRDPYLGTPTVIAETGAIRAVGGFDVDLPIAEDVDLYFKLCANRPYAILRQPLARFQLRAGSLTKRLSGYEDNLKVFDRLERTLPELSPAQHALFRTRRMEVYARWISDLLVRGNGRDARRVLKQSTQAGALPGYHRLYLKSLIAPAMPRLKRVRRALAS